MDGNQAAQTKEPAKRLSSIGLKPNGENDRCPCPHRHQSTVAGISAARFAHIQDLLFKNIESLLADLRRSPDWG
jgi:hypothetical protein